MTDPIPFMPVAVDTSSSIYDDFSRLLFLHAQSASSVLTDELQEESGQFRFLHTTCLTNLKGSVDGVDFGEIFGYEDFFTTRFVLSTFQTTTVFHSF